MSKHFANVADEQAIIVNIGSMAAINANGNAPLYCTAKAAVNMFSKESVLCDSAIVYSVLKDTVADRKARDYGTQNVSIYNN